MRSKLRSRVLIARLFFKNMTLHLLKHPVNPLALACLTQPSSQSAAVILSDAVTLPPLSVPVYRMERVCADSNTPSISFDKLVELIFAAEKVITW
jgi:hypothetical protein